MTTFGWDASHYDGHITRTIAERATAEGIQFFSHKVGESTGGDDPEDSTALAAFRDAGCTVISGYHVVRSGPVAPQVDALITLADRDEPWWRDFPGWFWQADLERWPYDQVPAQTGIDFATLLRERTGRPVFMYASRGQYGDQLTAWDGPLWNAAYGTTASHPGPFKDLYPGDSYPAWAPYSGKAPTLLQYTSSAIIAGLTTCDANAFRGTITELLALILEGNTMTSPQQIWEWDGIPAPPGVEQHPDQNPKWTPSSYLRYVLAPLDGQIKALQATCDVQGQVLAEILAAVQNGAGGGGATPAQVAAVVRAELNRTTLAGPTG